MKEKLLSLILPVLMDHWLACDLNISPRPQDASDRVDDNSDEVEDQAGVPRDPVAVAGLSDRLHRPKRNARTRKPNWHVIYAWSRLGFSPRCRLRKRGRFALTDSHWTIVMQYNLTEVEEENQNLSILLFKVKGQYDEFFQDLLSRNVSIYSPVRGIQQLVADYVSQTSDLTTLVPSPRKKRGLIDVGGQVLKFLFGTVTDSDLELTNSRINEIENLSDDLFHSTKDQITVSGNPVIISENLFSPVENPFSILEVELSPFGGFAWPLRIWLPEKMTSNLLPPHQFFKVLTSVENVIPPPLVISKDRQTYSVYSLDIFARECTRKFGKLTVSSLSDALLSIYQRPNCVVDLLMKEHVKLCSRKLISGLQSSVLIRTPTRWLYATSIETRVILNCLGRDANLNVSAITLKGCLPDLSVAPCIRVTLETLFAQKLMGCTVAKNTPYWYMTWRVRVSDLLRAALGDSTQHPQAAQTESPLQTLEETVRTVLRPDVDQGEIGRDQSGSMSTPRTTTDVKPTER
ncbi:hypothetical protein J6590_083326 [Homalodisca vitripennis]|nr:hypothetical protein J6590_083326 [Homalodisca vitripennis]